VAKVGSLVALNVHATKIVAAALDAGTGELQWFGVGRGHRGGRLVRRAAAAAACRL